MSLISRRIVCVLEFRYIKLQRGSDEDGEKTLQKRVERMEWNNFACVIDIMGFGIRGALKIQQSSIVDGELTERKRLWFSFCLSIKSMFYPCYRFARIFIDFGTPPLAYVQLLRCFCIYDSSRDATYASIWNRMLLWVCASVLPSSCFSFLSSDQFNQRMKENI